MLRLVHIEHISKDPVLSFSYYSTFLMYRCWTHELEETVKKVELYMEDACDQYFQDIKPRAVKVVLRKHYRNLTTLECHHIFYWLIPITLVLPSKSCHMVKGQLLYMYVHTNRLFLKLCMDMPANGCRCHPQNPQPPLNYCCTSRSLDIIQSCLNHC